MEAVKLKKISYNRTGRPDEEIDLIIEKFKKNHPSFKRLKKHFEGVIIEAKQNEKSQTFWVDKDPEFERVTEMLNRSLPKIVPSDPITIINNSEIFCITQTSKTVPMVGLGVLVVPDQPGQSRTVRSELFDELVATLNLHKLGRNIKFNPTTFVLPSGVVKENWWSIPVSDLNEILIALTLVFKKYKNPGLVFPYIYAGYEVDQFIRKHRSRD
jgi:hypothetical protein